MYPQSTGSSTPRNKPSFFRTLPDNIAHSPTGIAKIPNSPFPSLDPTKPIKSVYERAGFDVYKGDGNTKPIPNYKGRKVPDVGLRSQSTSQIAKDHSPDPRREKRNVSEFFTSQSRQIGNSKPDLTIDPALANNGYRNGSNASIIPSPLASSQSYQQEPPYNNQSTSHASSRAELTNSRSISPAKSNITPSDSVYASALSLSQVEKNNSTGLLPPADELGTNLSKTTSTHSSVPSDASTYNELNRRTSPERVQPVQRSLYNSHSPKRNSKASIQPSLERIPSVREQETSSGVAFGGVTNAASNVGSNTATNAAATVGTAASTIAQVAAVPLAFTAGAVGAGLLATVIPKRAPPPMVSPVPEQTPSFEAVEPVLVPEVVDPSFEEQAKEILQHGKNGYDLNNNEEEEEEEDDYEQKQNVQDEKLNAYVSKSGPDPYATDRYRDTYAEEQEEDLNEATSNFVEKPVVPAHKEISLDSDIENDITNVSDDFDSSLDSLAPKNQHFNFESEAVGDDDILKESPSHIVKEETVQEPKEVEEPRIDLPTRYQQDLNVDDYEDDDINEEEFEGEEAFDDQLDLELRPQVRVPEKKSIVHSETPDEYPEETSFNEDFNATSDEPKTQSVPDVKVNDMAFVFADLNPSENQIPSMNKNLFRDSNYSATSSVYTAVSPLVSIPTPFTPTFDSSFQASPLSNEKTTSQLREETYKELEGQLHNMDLNPDGLEEVYTPPLHIETHSVKQVSTDNLAEQKTPVLPSQSPLQQNVNSGFENKDLQSYNSAADFKESEQKEQTEQIKYPPGEGPCRKCGLEITTKPIYSKSGELSGQWHRSCFTCTMCDLKFSKKINCFVFNDQPYCDYHYHVQNNSLCKICGKGTVGQCLEIDSNDRYHVECLKCSSCETPITSDYVSINNKVHCEDCVMKLTSGPNADYLSATSKIEKRRTKLGFI